MPLFLSRHSIDFPLTDASLVINPSRSPYAISMDNYAKKVAALAQRIRVQQFLWAAEADKGFSKFESEKPVEWKLNVSSDRVIGFINQKLWLAYLSGNDLPLPPCFSENREQFPGRVSVLLQFPLFRHEIIRRTIFRNTSPVCNDFARKRG